MANNKKAAIYARVSSVSDRQSTARQVSDLNAYAVANGLNVVKTFEEKISGAKKNDERPVLCECLDFCEQNGVGVLLISELSRLGRNVWEVLENVKRCMDNNLNVYFQKEAFSLFLADGTPSPFAPVVISCLGMSAQLERENIQYRLNSGRAQYIANGGKLGRKVGSTKSNTEILEQYPEVVKHLRSAEKQRAAGAKATSIRTIAAACNVSPTTVQKVKAAMSGDK